MSRPRSITRILIAHFFRRFFDNDTVAGDGDTQTTVVRAVAAVAAPGMMIAFFLQLQYGPKPFERPPWGMIEDHYFFVLFSFVVMGAVSIFELEVLFPDRLDFLVLSPLSLKPLQMLAAKATALISFLALFLVACNFFGMWMLPAISRLNFFRQIYAHAAAVLLAGVFASLSFLALAGVLLCVFGATQFRIASPLIQMLSVTGLVLLMLHCLKYGDSLQALLSTEHLGMVRWLPPVWFLGVYEQLFHGAAAPPFAKEMTHRAVRGTVVAALVVLLTYPTAWARTRKMALEGPSCRRRQPTRWLARLVHAAIRPPQQRAIFHFIGQTIVRNNRYQVYLAMYCGAGLALAAACTVRLHAASGVIRPSLSQPGLHAVLPLLLFWTTAGLRTAFAFPLSLSAAWVFRITGAGTAGCASSGRKWVFACAAGVIGCVMILLRAAGWNARQLIVQAVCGLCLCVLLTDGFFSLRQSVPFTRPRMPGRTSLPLMLTLYFGIFPPFILWVMHLETQIERHPARLLIVAIITGIIHAALAAMRRSSSEIEEEMEGYDGEFQVLGLS